MAMDRIAAARSYYDALDDHDYDALAALLAPDFVHDRPDRTIEGRDAFVRFMRAERPNPDTTHDVVAVAEGDGEVVVRGRLFDGDTLLVRFCDAFAFADERVSRVTTYTN